MQQLGDGIVSMGNTKIRCRMTKLKYESACRCKVQHSLLHTRYALLSRYKEKYLN